MNKQIRKALALILCGASVFSYAACGGGKKSGGEGTIQISLWESGWGSDWLYAMADRFEELNPDYKVEVDASAADGDITNLLPVPDNNPYDIIMGCNTDASLRTTYYEDLTDILSSKYKNETKTIGEKIGEEMCYLLTDNNGKNERMFYGAGYYTIIYNGDIFDNYEYEVPKTTDEMVSLIDTMKVDGVVPFIHFVNGGYWHTMLWTWAMQYVGYENFYKMSEEPTLEGLTNDENGVPQALDALWQMLGDKKNYFEGSTGMDFTTSQSLFLAPSKRSGKDIAMMVNGSWMENEMKNSEDELNKNMKAMKTPVLSSIIDKCDTIADDETLASVIAAIDEGKTAYSGVSNADFKLIKAAREIEVTNANGLEICVPNYSDNITGAKEFIKFFYSDEGLKIWADKTHIKSVAEFDNEAMRIDTNNFSAFEKSQWELAQQTRPIGEGATSKKHTIFKTGGCSIVAGFENGNYAGMMVATPSTNATTIWSKIKENLNNNWSTYWANAGLTAP